MSSHRLLLLLFVAVIMAMINLVIIVSAEEEEDQLVSLRQKLENKLKSVIDEDDKAECCEVAFMLCEPAPEGVTLRPQRRLLAQAKRKCKKIWTVPMNTKEEICSFYSSTPVNCAYTPLSAADFERYLDNLDDCCESAQAFCKDKENELSLYYAKQDCMGYAKRNPEDICKYGKSDECAVAGHN
jgi:hypothetical protein